MCDCNMNITEVANKLFWSRNNVVYHMSKIKELYGLDVRKFYDLVKLEQMAREPEKEIQVKQNVYYCLTCGEKLSGRRKKYCSKHCMKVDYINSGYWRKIKI